VALLVQVAAVVLVAWQEDPHNLAYMDLLPLFNHEAPLQMLGFKLINDGKAGAADKASPGFYIVAAQLIKVSKEKQGRLSAWCAVLRVMPGVVCGPLCCQGHAPCMCLCHCWTANCYASCQVPAYACICAHLMSQ
jgi:hypothetical protein